MSHVGPATGLLAGLFVSFALVMALAQAGAQNARAGENLVALFAPGREAASVIAALADAGVQRFEPLGFANAWLLQASDEGLARALRQRGALLVLRAKGPIHFALGCASPASL